jgi:hypothetical protein
MSLPRGLQYINAIDSSYARNYQSNIAPQNGLGPYGPGETIIVNIPTSRNTVLSGGDSVLKFNLTVTNGGTANNFIRLGAAGAHGAIQRIRLWHGSTLLSDIDDYGNLVAMCMTIQESGDRSHGIQTILAGCESLSVMQTTVPVLTVAGGLTAVADAWGKTEPLHCGARLNGNAQVATNTATVAKTFCIPLMNFLSYSEKYCPLYAMTGSPLRVEIQLVDNPLKMVCSAQALTTFTVSNVEYIGNFMEVSDSGMSKVQMASGPQLKWVVQDWRSYSHTANAATGAEISVPIAAKFNSLRSLVTSDLTKAAGVATFYANGSHPLGLSSYTVRIGSRVVPTKAPSTYPEMFSELIRAFGSIADLNHEPNISSAVYAEIAEAVANNEGLNYPTTNTHQNAFYTGLDLESYSNSGMQNVYQGMNTSTEDVFLTLNYGTVPNGPQLVKINTYAYYDQVIIIENGFCTVQY